MSRLARNRPSEEQLTILRNAVRNKFGRDITDVNSCKQIAKDIYYRTRTLLSYNTIRRFFKLLPNSSVIISPSTYKVLIQYCGYKTEQAFYKYNGNVKHLDLEENFRVILVKEETDFINAVISIINENEYHPMRYDFLCKCLLWAHGKGFYKFHKLIFTLNEIFDIDKHNEVDLFNFFQTYGVLINELPLPERKEVVEFICNYKSVRSGYIEQFVDIDNIEFFFECTMNEYIKRERNDQALVFYQAIACFYFYKTRKRDDFKHAYQSLWKNYHPAMQIPAILLGRLASCDIMAIDLKLNTKNDFLKKLYLNKRKIHKTEITYFSLYPLMMAMRTSNKNLFIALAEQLIVNTESNDNDYFAHHANASLSIYQCYYHYLSGNLERSKSLRHDIKPELFAKFEAKQLNLCLQILDQELTKATPMDIIS